MANHLKFCGCAGCKRGKHSLAAKTRTRLVIRKNRSDTKVALRRGEEPTNTCSAGRTD